VRLDLLQRPEWDAELGLGPAMRLPAVGVHVHHSVTIVDDDGIYHATGDVAADMREIERIGKQRFGRFPYCYCGHPSGVVAVGAGLSIGAHTAGFNSTTLGYCFIGNYDIAALSTAQIRAFQQWRADMVAIGALTPDHYVQPHQARKQTACPGRHTMAVWGQLTGRVPIETEDPLAGITLDQIGLKVMEAVGAVVDPELADRHPNIRKVRDNLARITIGAIMRGLSGPDHEPVHPIRGVDGVLRPQLDDYLRDAKARGVI
jgi:hypothetical protein